ncbi:hypothetical protein [Nonomuraea typhae]|uniref:Uncharacterized protein n=1 Tax=Nonomuraea typhae TaxID=2603600 RepID=A0ABW7YQR3_9ACTN
MNDEMEWEERGVVYRRAKLALDLGQTPLNDAGHAGDLPGRNLGKGGSVLREGVSLLGEGGSVLGKGVSLLGESVHADPAAPSPAAPHAVGFPGTPRLL